jgi:hypothetical protein
MMKSNLPNLTAFLESNTCAGIPTPINDTAALEHTCQRSITIEKS